MTNKQVKKQNNFNSLKTDSDFELVYKEGSPIVSEDKKIKAKYLLRNNGGKSSVKIGLSIASKKGKGVWRNRIKRLLREAIRSEIDILRDIAAQKRTSLLIIFSPHSINQTNSKKIFLKEIKAPVLDVLLGLKKRILSAN